MGKGIAAAVRTVFPHAPHFICHYHFLKAVGKNLFGGEQDIIRERLRKHCVRATLKRTVARLEKTLSATGFGVDALIGGLENERLPGECSLGSIPTQAAYTLMRWVLDTGAESNGCGFPFDQTYLVFYRRLQEVGEQLHRLFRIRLQDDWKENKVYSSISHDLVAVLNDRVLRDAALRMQEKVAVFDRLRKAMRITLPENKRGLNDTGELPAGMKTIETEVRTFRARLVRSKDYTRQHGYRRLVDQLDIYWEQLLAGKTTLEERFAEVDSREIRERLVRETTITGSACPQIRKIIRLPQLPQAIVKLLQQSAS